MSDINAPVSSTETIGSTNETSSINENTEQFDSDINELESSLTHLNEHPPKTYRVKIDGEELDVTEDELLSGYQSTKSAQQRFNEAARLRKQSEELIRIAKTDPKKLLAHPDIGVDLRQFANEILAEMVEEEMLSPQEKELRDTKKRLMEYEDERRQAEEVAKNAEFEKYSQLYEQEYTTNIVSALETSGLPKTESTVKKMASYMLLALENGLDVKPSDVVEFVKNDYITEVNSLFGSADSDTILSLLGENISSKVVKGHLNKVKGRTPQNKVTELTQPKNATTDKSHSRTLTRDEWLANIKKRANG